jgi:hypothetical protein
MGVPEDVLCQAWAWAGGRCECKRPGHDHRERCAAKLDLAARGSVQPGGWDYRVRVPLAQGGGERAENLEILCTFCYLAVQFGRWRRPEAE